MDENVFGVLVYVKLLLVERELMAWASTELEPKSIVAKREEIFFVVPKSNERIVFMNSEAEFLFGDDPLPKQSIRIPYDIIYLDRLNIQKIFASIEFLKFKRKDFRYFTTSILRGYIPFEGIQPIQIDSEFEI